MEIIDCRIHEPLPRLAERHVWDARLLLEVTLAQMDGAGVDRAVVSTHDLDWACYAAEHSCSRIVSTPSGIDMAAPDVEEAVEQWLAVRGVLGFRVHILAPSPFWSVSAHMIEQCRAGMFDRFFAACERRQAPLMIACYPDLTILPVLARNFPGLTFILDNMGMAQPPLPAARPAFRNLAEIAGLAGHPNLAINLCGMPTLSQLGYPFEDIVAPVRSIINAFGQDRVVWGSDIQRVNARMAKYPNDGYGQGSHTYGDAVHFIRSGTWLSEAEKAALLGQSLRTLTRWPVGTGTHDGSEPPSEAIRR